MHPPTRPAETSGRAAGFWPRAVAWLVDAGLIALPVAVIVMGWGSRRFDTVTQQWRELGTLTGQTMLAAAERGDSAMAMLSSLMSSASPVRPAMTAFVGDLYAAIWPVVASFVLLGLLYWPLQEAGRHRATLGKRMLGLCVARVDDDALDIRRAYLRHIAGSLSWLTLNIGHLMAGNAPRHQALHDRIAKTQVLWQQDASRRVPRWGWMLLAIAFVLPLAFAVSAARSLMDAMQAVLLI